MENPELRELARSFRSGHLTRRALLQRATVLLSGTALASFLASCGANRGAGGPAQPSGASPGAGTPQKGGTFSMAIIADPLLNPLISSGVQSVMVNKVIFDGLVRPEPGTLAPKPALATSWESTPDAKQWSFKLRQGVKWHDGKPFTADDVKFTYDARLTQKGLAAAFRELESVDKLDDFTVRFNLKAPLGNFLEQMSYLQFIVPKHVLEGKDQTTFTEFSKKAPIGTGSFKIQEFVTGNYVSLTANPDYWDGAPYLERCVFKVLPDVNTQVAQLKTREMTFATIEPVNVASVKGDPNLKLDPIDYVNHYYIAFQVKRPIFADPKVRLGLSHAIDRQAILDKVVLGYGTVATGTVPTALKWAYNDKLKPIPFDKKKALDLLAQAGWTPGTGGTLQKGGEPLKFTLSVDKGNPAREQTATIVQQYFKDIGCDVTLETMEWGAFAQKRWLGKDYDAIHMWWITPPDPDQFDFYGCDGPSNHPNFCNKAMTDVLLEARGTIDREKRRQLYFKYQELEMEDPPVSALYYPQEIRVYDARLQNFPSIGIRDALIYANKMWLKQA